MLALNQPALELVDSARRNRGHHQQQPQQPLEQQPEASSQARGQQPQQPEASSQQAQQQQQQTEGSGQTRGQQPRPQAPGGTPAAAAAGVRWAEAGSVLAVSSSGGRRVPGLQLNLTPHSRPRRVVAAAAAPAQAPPQLPADGPPPQLQPPSPWGAAAAPGPAAVAEPPRPTVISASHFLPFPSLPHARVSELAKAMGCLELADQLRQASAPLPRGCTCARAAGAGLTGLTPQPWTAARAHTPARRQAPRSTFTATRTSTPTPGSTRTAAAPRTAGAAAAACSLRWTPRCRVPPGRAARRARGCAACGATARLRRPARLRTWPRGRRCSRRNRVCRAARSY